MKKSCEYCSKSFNRPDGTFRCPYCGKVWKAKAKKKPRKRTG